MLLKQQMMRGQPILSSIGMLTLAFSLLVFSASTSGLSACPKSLFAQQLNLVRQIAVIGEPDRMTEEDYATAKGLPLNTVRDRYAATGVIECPKGKWAASMQLVGKDNRVVTSRHVFQDDNCKDVPRSRPLQCVAVFKDSQGEQVIPFQRVLAQGRCTPGELRTDWMVLELARPVERIRPYVVAPFNGLTLRGASVTAALGGSMDFPRPGTTKPIKSLGTCNVRHVGGYHPDSRSLDLVSTDCDVSYGASGGSILRETDPSPTLLGVVRGVSADSTAASTDFDLHTRSSSFVPVAGDLLLAIQRAVYD
jgi:Trypsin-like peptidase domain